MQINSFQILIVGHLFFGVLGFLEVLGFLFFVCLFFSVQQV